MRKIVINLLLCAFCIAILIISGIRTIDKKTKTIETKSSFELTEFEYVINTPSKEQINTLKSNQEAIKKVFPCYCFETKLKGNSTDKVALLLSEDMSDYSISLFNDQTKLSGEFDEDGIMLDKKAADMLGVKVGDTVKTTLANREFSFKVSSIYYSSTFRGLDKGLALAKYSSEIATGFGKELYYDLAFIDENDSAKCQALMNSYIPMGPLITEDEYVSKEKENNTCPSGLTEEEWTQNIKNAYASYKTNYLNREFKDSVKAKSVYMEEAEQKTVSDKSAIDAMCVGIAIAIVVVYSVLSIIIIFINKEDDLVKIKDGEKNVVLKHLALAIIRTIVIACIVGVALIIYAKSNKDLSDYMPIIFVHALPILASIVFICIYALYYKKKVCPTINSEITY